MIQAAVISNGIEGLHYYFQSNEKVTYHLIEIEAHFNPDFSTFDLLIVPNGSDHIALYNIKEKIFTFLNQGKTVCCFDGWFTDWLPNNRWIMDNSKKTIEVRYTIENDKHHLFKGIDINALIFSNGISGWWACGYIEPSPQAQVLLKDTWQRAIMVLDEDSTKGTIIATASGPLADVTYQTTNDNNSINDLSKLYQNILQFIINKKVRK